LSIDAGLTVGLILIIKSGMPNWLWGS